MGVGKFFTDLFGKAKETAEDFAVQAEAGFDKIKETTAPIFDKAEDFAKETIEKVKENSNPIIVQAEEYFEVAKEKAAEFSTQAEEEFTKTYDSIRENAAPIIIKAEEILKQTTDKIVDVFDSATAKTEPIVEEPILDTEAFVENTAKKTEGTEES